MIIKKKKEKNYMMHKETERKKKIKVRRNEGRGMRVERREREGRGGNICLFLYLLNSCSFKYFNSEFVFTMITYGEEQKEIDGKGRRGKEKGEERCCPAVLPSNVISRRHRHRRGKALNAARKQKAGVTVNVLAGVASRRAAAGVVIRHRVITTRALHRESYISACGRKTTGGHKKPMDARGRRK